jgi:hypothetical protein
MRVACSLDRAKVARATGSEPPSSTQIITGTVCTSFGSDMGACPPVPDCALLPGREPPVEHGRSCNLGRDDSSSWAKQWPDPFGENTTLSTRGYPVSSPARPASGASPGATSGVSSGCGSVTAPVGRHPLLLRITVVFHVGWAPGEGHVS